MKNGQKSQINDVWLLKERNKKYALFCMLILLKLKGVSVIHLLTIDCVTYSSFFCYVCLFLLSSSSVSTRIPGSSSQDKPYRIEYFIVSDASRPYYFYQLRFHCTLSCTLAQLQLELLLWELYSH